MDVKPFLHKHHLLFDEYENQAAFCDECNQKIDGWAFTCELCKFWLHQSCAEQKLPPMISHPRHSKPLLQNTNFSDFICDKCFTLSRGCKYSNEGQSFNLDVICAFLVNDQTIKEESERSIDMGKKIQHFCHDDSLTLLNYRKVRRYEYCCSWCEKPLSGMSYGCVQCSPIPFFLHEFCLHKIPHTISKHHFHPSHPLSIRSSIAFKSKYCHVCTNKIGGHYSYTCLFWWCKFRIHILCAKLKPTLRHDIHEHKLTYIARGVNDRCLYRCVQCHRSYGFERLIPSIINHKYHMHSLTIMTSFREDGSGEYYCDICEEQRNPENHAYCCKECTYIAHIECGLGNEVVDAENFSLKESKSTGMYRTGYLDIGGQRIDRGLQLLSWGRHVDHVHPLVYFDHIRQLFVKEVNVKNKNPLCAACEEEVCHAAYAYVCSTCGYYLHGTCFQLSNELQQDSFGHPLVLLARGKSILKNNNFICDICRVISSGFLHYCFKCNFKIDMKCVVGGVSNNVKQGPKEFGRPTNLFHFIHDHELFLFNCRPTSNRSFRCEACFLKISGPAYCCLECSLFVHESCLGKLPRDIQIQSHPQHNFLPHTTLRISKVCIACKSEDPSFWYKCSQCDIYIHFSCAGSLLQRPLSSKFHPHDLYLFSRNKPRFLQKHQSSQCEKCNKLLEKQSIYRCIQCDINFHFQCVEVFYRVKCKHHIHPLTLKACFAEVDSEEDYCDICEEKRDPENDIYYCEECDGLFISHVDCATYEVEEVLLQYGPFPYSLPRLGS